MKLEVEGEGRVSGLSVEAGDAYGDEIKACRL